MEHTQLDIDYILNMLQTGCELIFECDRLIAEGGDLSEQLSLLTEASEGIHRLFETGYASGQILPLGKNLLLSLEKLTEYNSSGDLAELQTVFYREFYPLYILWFEEIQLCCSILQDDRKLQEYFKAHREACEEFRSRPKEEPEEKPYYPFKASIFILIYNNLQLSKECVESVVEHTSHIPCELVIFDNGSNEETREWIESLGIEKVIRLEHNIGMVLPERFAFLAGIREGEFWVSLNNDVVVTENWLDNLLACIESDPAIGMVSPCCNSTSNFQQIPTRYTNMEQMQKFASGYNRSNPDLWEERVRLMQFLAVYRPEAYACAGGYDNYFSFGMFADDDFCLRIRRSGYKLIFCKDTFVHHYGSATIKESQFEVMNQSRSRFVLKYGFDLWPHTEGNPEWLKLHDFAKPGSTRLLLLNPSLGAEALQIKKVVEEAGGELALKAVTPEACFEPDLRLLTEDVTITEDCAGVLSGLPENGFDGVLICRNAGDLMQLDEVLVQAYRVLKPGGVLLMKLPNRFYFRTLIRLAERSPVNPYFSPEDLDRFAVLNVEALQERLTAIGFSRLTVEGLRGAEVTEEERELFNVFAALFMLENKNRKIPIAEALTLLNFSDYNLAGYKGE